MITSHGVYFIHLRKGDGSWGPCGSNLNTDSEEAGKSWTSKTAAVSDAETSKRRRRCISGIVDCSKFDYKSAKSPCEEDVVDKNRVTKRTNLKHKEVGEVWASEIY